MSFQLKALDQLLDLPDTLLPLSQLENEEDLLQIFAEIYNQAGIDVRRQYLTQLLEYYQKKDLIEYGFMIPRKSKRDESVVLDLTKRYTKWDEKRDTLNVMIFQFMQSQTEKSSIVGKRVPKGSILDTLKQFEQEGIKIWDGDETQENEQDEELIFTNDDTYHKQTYVSNLKELHQMYNIQHPELAIGYTYFCEVVQGLYIKQSRGTDLCPLCQTAILLRNKQSSQLLTEQEQFHLDISEIHLQIAHHQKQFFRDTKQSLNENQVILVADYKQSLPFPYKRQQSSTDFYHALKVSVLTFICYSISPTGERRKIAFTKNSHLQNKDCFEVIDSLKTILTHQFFNNKSQFFFFFDNGSCFRAAVTLAFLLKNSKNTFNINSQIYITYWAECHGKSVVDSYFGNYGKISKDVCKSQESADIYIFSENMEKYLNNHKQNQSDEHIVQVYERGNEKIEIKLLQIAKVKDYLFFAQINGQLYGAPQSSLQLNQLKILTNLKLKSKTIIPKNKYPPITSYQHHHISPPKELLTQTPQNPLQQEQSQFQLIGPQSSKNLMNRVNLLKQNDPFNEKYNNIKYNAPKRKRRRIDEKEQESKNEENRFSRNENEDSDESQHDNEDSDDSQHDNEDSDDSQHDNEDSDENKSEIEVIEIPSDDDSDDLSYFRHSTMNQQQLKSRNRV